MSRKIRRKLGKYANTGRGRGTLKKRKRTKTRTKRKHRGRGLIWTFCRRPLPKKLEEKPRTTTGMEREKFTGSWVKKAAKKK